LCCFVCYFPFCIIQSKLGIPVDNKINMYLLSYMKYIRFVLLVFKNLVKKDKMSFIFYCQIALQCVIFGSNIEIPLILKDVKRFTDVTLLVFLKHIEHEGNRIQKIWTSVLINCGNSANLLCTNSIFIRTLFTLFFLMHNQTFLQVTL